MDVHEAREILERLSRDWEHLSEEEKHGSIETAIDVLS
jgi:hypothetical protein